MVREFVARHESKTMRLAVGNNISSGNLRFFTAVLGIGRYQKLIQVRSQDRAITFVKPLWLRPDGLRSRTAPSLPS